MDTNKPKTTVFNLIILDESGSMDCLKAQTISGCNETLNVIRSAQQKAGDKVRHLVSIYAFQSDSNVPSRYLIKNQPIADVKNINGDDYKPWGATPLYDAVGSTISELRVVAETHEDAMAIITIITDGMENSSRRYNADKVASIIDAVKELGWTVNFIGANIDVKAESAKLHINNSMSWTASEEGTNDMYDTLICCTADAYDGVEEDAAMPMQARMESRKKRSMNFFKR